MNSCAGCLGDGGCWVCLGTGRLPTQVGRPAVCHACGGSARCTRCSAPPLRVTDVRVERGQLCASPR